MSTQQTELVANAVWEGAESAAKAYGGESADWIKRAIEETASEWSLTYDEVRRAALEA